MARNILNLLVKHFTGPRGINTILKRNYTFRIGIFKAYFGDDAHNKSKFEETKDAKGRSCFDIQESDVTSYGYHT